MTQLLVSVRSVGEALAARAGGCDIVDIKEPRNGPLGMAAPDEIHAIVEAVRDRSPPVPVSAALGEALDWATCPPPAPLPAGLSFVKLGTAGLGDGAGWLSAWQQVRRQFDGAVPDGTGWVAVTYADWRAAEAPAPESVVEAALAENLRGVLIDTYHKRAASLCYLFPVDDLRRLAARVQKAGLLFALAGGVRIPDLDELAAVNADVIGIRGAACRDGRREAEICAALVSGFHAALTAAKKSQSRSPQDFRSF